MREGILAFAQVYADPIRCQTRSKSRMEAAPFKRMHDHGEILMPSPKDSLNIESTALQSEPKNPHWLMKIRWIAWLAGHFPPGLFLRYLAVGVWNTFAGFSIYALLTYYLTKTRLHAAYLLTVAPSCFINITMAFFLYKRFVFRTKGNYWREYRRTMAVYWSLFIPAMLILPVLVQLLRWLFHMGAAAPYVANALLTSVGVIYSFIGHKKYSFNQENA